MFGFPPLIGLRIEALPITRFPKPLLGSNHHHCFLWMLKVLSDKSQEASLSPSLSDLSRNSSVISVSSSDSGQPLPTPRRPRPIRTFSAPRSKSPQPQTPRATRPPSYLSRNFGDAPPPLETKQTKTKAQSKTRNSAVNVNDFEFGETLGEGSYSTVILQ